MCTGYRITHGLFLAVFLSLPSLQAQVLIGHQRRHDKPALDIRPHGEKENAESLLPRKTLVRLS